ncbi:MAG: PhnD/SsuA/transferrin family substrate-binding protein [Nitrospiraceae bacterium]|nr:PhnD/SsuA/transferrin family substrate-binding protein [Nitrospiraceae bacterium]
MKKPSPKAVLKAILVSLALFLFCCTQAAAKQKLTLMLIPLQSPSVMYGNFLPLKRYLEARLGGQVEIKVAKTRGEIIDSLRKGEADLAFMCPTLYCEAGRRVKIVPLAKLRVNGSSEYRSVLLVRSDSDIRRAADLVGRTFVYGRYYCPESGLLPKVVLQKVGIDDGDFMETVKLGSDESAILAVMAKLFDATGVSEMAARPYLGKGVRILSYSYPIPQYLFAARASLGKETLDRVRKAMLSVNSSRPEEVLGSIEPGADGLTRAGDRDYDIVRILMKSVLGEKGLLKTADGAVRFVVEPVSFEPEMFRDLNSLMLYLSRASGRRFQLVIPGNTGVFMRMMRAGEGEFFLQNHHLYSEAVRRDYIRGIAAIARAGFPEDRGVVIVNSRSRIRTLRELAGKRAGIVSLYSDSGFLAQQNLLKEKEIPASSVRFVVLKSYERVIMEVYQNSISAGFVSFSSLQSMRKDIDLGRIRVLAETQPLQDWIIAAKQGMDANFAERVKKALVRYSCASRPAGPGNFRVRELNPSGE